MTSISLNPTEKVSTDLYDIYTLNGTYIDQEPYIYLCPQPRLAIFGRPYVASFGSTVTSILDKYFIIKAKPGVVTDLSKLYERIECSLYRDLTIEDLKKILL